MPFLTVCEETKNGMAAKHAAISNRTNNVPLTNRFIYSPLVLADYIL
jgi:hypothetical protein